MRPQRGVYNVPTLRIEVPHACPHAIKRLVVRQPPPVVLGLDKSDSTVMVDLLLPVARRVPQISRVQPRGYVCKDRLVEYERFGLSVAGCRQDSQPIRRHLTGHGILSDQRHPSERSASMNQGRCITARHPECVLQPRPRRKRIVAFRNLTFVEFGNLQSEAGMSCIQRFLVLDDRGFKVVVEYVVEMKGEIFSHLLTETITREIPG